MRYIQKPNPFEAYHIPHVVSKSTSDSLIAFLGKEWESMWDGTYDLENQRVSLNLWGTVVEVPFGMYLKKDRNGAISIQDAGIFESLYVPEPSLLATVGEIRRD